MHALSDLEAFLEMAIRGQRIIDSFGFLTRWRYFTNNNTKGFDMKPSEVKAKYKIDKIAQVQLVSAPFKPLQLGVQLYGRGSQIEEPYYEHFTIQEDVNTFNYFRDTYKSIYDDALVYLQHGVFYEGVYLQPIWSLVNKEKCLRASGYYFLMRIMEQRYNKNDSRQLLEWLTSLAYTELTYILVGEDGYLYGYFGSNNLIMCLGAVQLFDPVYG